MMWFLNLGELFCEYLCQGWILVGYVCVVFGVLDLDLVVDMVVVKGMLVCDVEVLVKCLKDGSVLDVVVSKVNVVDKDVDIEVLEVDFVCVLGLKVDI